MEEKYLWCLALLLIFLPILYISYQAAYTRGYRKCVSMGTLSTLSASPPPKYTEPVNKLISPTKTADLQSILTYLLARKTYINGAPYNSDIMKALSENWEWNINNEVEPPTAMYHGATRSTYWLLWDDKVAQWDVTTISPYSRM